MNKKHKKKLKRAAKRKKDKAAAQESQNKIKKQLSMFDKLPDKCSACRVNFPKTREAHMTWQVVVREENVRLFCPECQQKTKKVVEGRDVS